MSSKLVVVLFLVINVSYVFCRPAPGLMKPENDRKPFGSPNARGQYDRNDNDMYSGSSQQTTKRPTDLGGKNDAYYGSSGSTQTNRPQTQPNTSGGRDTPMNSYDKNNDKLSDSDNAYTSNSNSNNVANDKYSNNQQSNNNKDPINTIQNAAHLVSKPIEEVALSVPHHGLNLQPGSHMNDMVSSVSGIAGEHIPSIPVLPGGGIMKETTFTEKMVIGAKQAVDKAAQLASQTTHTVANGIKKAIHSIATNPVFPLVRPEMQHHLEMTNMLQDAGSGLYNCK